MGWIIQEAEIGVQGIDETADTAQHPLGTIVKAKHETYGSGEFIYLKSGGTRPTGQWVTYQADDFVTLALAANAIGPVAIVTTTVAVNAYGWHQIEGKAIGLAATSFADGANVYATATAGTVDDAVVAGDRVKRAKGASDVGVPGSGLAEFEIDRPFMDDGLAA
jgi:hypothetical protein